MGWITKCHKKEVMLGQTVTSKYINNTIIVKLKSLVAINNMARKLMKKKKKKKIKAQKQEWKEPKIITAYVDKTITGC